MNVRPLTRDEFIGTFSEPMQDVTVEESGPLIDIWPYVEEVLARESPEVLIDDADVGYVYLSGVGRLRRCKT